MSLLHEGNLYIATELLQNLECLQEKNYTTAKGRFPTVLRETSYCCRTEVLQVLQEEDRYCSIREISTASKMESYR